MTETEARAELARLEGLGDLGSDHDEQKAKLRRTIAQHEAQNGVRPALSGADRSMQDLVERQRIGLRSPAEQLAWTEARLEQVAALAQAGDPVAEAELPELREQVKHLERSIAAQQAQRQADPDDVEIRGRMGEGFGRVLAMVARYERLQAEKETVGREILREGRGLNVDGLRMGLPNKLAQQLLLDKVLGQYDAWRTAELVPGTVARLDQVVKKSLTARIGELYAMLTERE